METSVAGNGYILVLQFLSVKNNVPFSCLVPHIYIYRLNSDSIDGVDVPTFNISIRWMVHGLIYISIAFHLLIIK